MTIQEPAVGPPRPWRTIALGIVRVLVDRRVEAAYAGVATVLTNLVHYILSEWSNSSMAAYWHDYVAQLHMHCF